MEPLFHPIDLLDEIEQFAVEAWETSTPERKGIYPRMDMFEDKDELVMRAELPGIRKEDIDISLEGDCLTISAEKKPEKLSKDATSYMCERCFGNYSRTVSLPFPINTDKVSSTFENGLLEVRLPIAEEAKAKHIEIKVK
jgi:HSP20 family protein